MNYTVSEENYLKTIFHLQQVDDTVSTSQVAEAIQTKPASVTDMMKKLHTKKLLNYKRYHGFSLSAEGRRVAVGIIRRHRLWEYFLSEKLAFSWEEVHSIAEELEHVRHKKLIDRLDDFLGNPPFDPHGDPIPDSKGKMQPADQICLTELPLNQKATISHVSGQSTALLETLAALHIRIGSTLEVRKRSTFDGSVQVKLHQKLQFISLQVAQHLFVHKQ